MGSVHKNLVLLEHPLIKRDITLLRDVNTDCEQFRSALNRIANLLAVEISKDFKLSRIEVESPLEKTDGYNLEQEVILVPVLRAGLGMINGFLQVIPDAKVGHIGLQRDEKTLKPVEYYYKTPADLDIAEVILIDPMLATGGSASAALTYLKEKGAAKLAFASLICAPEGLRKIEHDHPEITVFTAALDRELNNKGYILPGLGDAGDRTFGTL